MELESPSQANGFLSEAKLEKLGKNYLDFIASAESRFPLLFGREAQIKKFKKFNAAKLEYQQGSRGGKYSELGTKRDILNKLSQNKLMERRLKKAMLKKSRTQRFLGKGGPFVRSEGSRETRRRRLCSGKAKNPVKSGKGWFRRQSREQGQGALTVKRIDTGREKTRRMSKSLKRNFGKEFEGDRAVASCARTSRGKENSERGNQVWAQKYQIKKSRSSFFFRKKKRFLKTDNEDERRARLSLAPFLKIQRLKSQTGTERVDS